MCFLAWPGYGQTVLQEKVIDDSLSVTDLYYRKFNEINGFILKVLKENGRGDGNLVVLDYIDLKDKGFLRREKFNLQYFNNALEKQWEVEIPPELYSSVPKPFYQITANNKYIYFFEAGSLSNSTYFNCKVTQLNYDGEIVQVSNRIDVAFRVITTFPSDRGLHIVGHRFLQGPEYYLGTFSARQMAYSDKKITLPHTEREIGNWAINKSEYEQVTGFTNNFGWLKKAYIINPMNTEEGIYSQYVCLDTSGQIRKSVKINFDATYRNFLGIDTECFQELDKVPTIVLKGAKTGPYFDVYMKDLSDRLLFHKELHFYDIRKYLQSEYRYYDYREINYNHYRNVDHFKAVIYDNFNNNFILIDKVPDGTYFFHVNQEFELKRVDYSKEFNGIAYGSSKYNIGIVNGFSTIYMADSFYPRKTAFDFVMKLNKENPRDYYYTVLCRDNYHLLIVDDTHTKKTKVYKLGK